MISFNEHLKSRWFNPSLYNGVYISEEMYTLTVYLWCLSGKLVGFQQYCPNLPKIHLREQHRSRYYTYVISEDGYKCKHLVAWGIETIRCDQPLYLTEGIFDAMRLHYHGLSAIAVISNNPKPLRNWLSLLPVEKISCIQGDKASQKLKSYGDSFIQLPDNEDVGSISEKEFEKLFLHK